MREAFKVLARGLATVAALPAIASFWLRSPFLGPNKALEGSSQALGLLPGLIGIYVRRAFLQAALSGCASTATIEHGTLFSQSGARIDDNVYVGPRCHLGLVHLERDVLLGAGVHVPSGARTHGTDDPHSPIRDQGGERTLVRIGEGTWIGSAAIVMADVGRHCVIGAGAVVTRPVEDYSIAVGSPARTIRKRDDRNTGPS